MLTHFDWVLRSQTGTELLATIRGLVSNQNVFDTVENGPGEPYIASSGPCNRCWIYPRQEVTGSGRFYCKTCHHILEEETRLRALARDLVTVWGHVNQLPTQFKTGSGFKDTHLLGIYVHDSNHFLLLMYRKELKTWLQELGLYHGDNLKGLLVVFPTIGSVAGVNMGDVLSQAIHQESRFPMNQLRVQFFASPYEVLKPSIRSRQKTLTFNVTEFIQLLGMAEVFRATVRYEEQRVLEDLLQLNNDKEVSFYWGRTMGQFSPQARDLLDGWGVRNWKLPQLKLLYELIDYANFVRSN